MSQKYKVQDSEAGNRLDRFVAERAGTSRAAACRLIELGKVQVGGRLGKKGTVLLRGDEVTLEALPQDDQGTAPVPQPELPLRVLYEDADVVAFDKPVGLPSHPLRAGERGTAVSALVARYPECAAAGEHAREGGLCHRLDTFTSGVLLAARSRPAWLRLRAAFHDGAVRKEYLALCSGVPLGDSGRITDPLLPAPGGERVRVGAPEEAYEPGAMDAQTEFTVLRRGAAVSLLSVRIGAGRRHQIRAHLAHLGLPLYGDTLYGGPALPPELAAQLSPEEYGEAQGPVLHAALLAFPRQGGALVEVRAELPPGRRRLLELLLGP